MAGKTAAMDSYHASKLLDFTNRAMKALAVGGYDYKTRLIWAIEEMPMVELYLEYLQQPLQRPYILHKHQIDPRDISRSELIIAITHMHWRDMHKLGNQLVDWVSMAEGIAHEVHTLKQRSAA